LNRDGTTGALTFAEAERNGWEGVDGLSGASSIAVSSGGRHVYVAALFENAVVVFG
jgi:hypothetical protein